jgi:hypothetical protein
VHLKKPFFRYNTVSAERHDHISASGKKASMYVGPREFRDFSFHWLTDANKTSMETFWQSVRDGSAFWIVFDDSVRKIDGTWTIDPSGDPYICGDDSDGNVITETEYTMESTELIFTPEEVYGYWSVTMRVREVV